MRHKDTLEKGGNLGEGRREEKGGRERDLSRFTLGQILTIQIYIN